jgi:hypothetical protein
MRIFASKRGTDKPIEIFIALFVILAVAMVILKMFSTQIEEKRKEMEEQQQQERIRMAEQDLKSFCATKCSDAHKSLKNKVTFCLSYYPKEVDINMNSMADYTDKLDNVQGFCEDRVYCAAYDPCGSLDVKTCKSIVCEYLGTNMGVTGDIDKAKRLVGYDQEDDKYDEESYFNPGECWGRLTDSQKQKHWFNTLMSVPDLNSVDDSTPPNYLGGKCFLKEGTCQQTYSEVDKEFGTVYPDGDSWLAACPVYS